MARRNELMTEIDKIIGDKVCSLRVSEKLSRQQLASKIGTTHQQLQKYEKGTNRISAGRLILIAKALKKPVSYFYEEVDSVDTTPMLTEQQRMCIEVSKNFMKLKNTERQNAVNTLIKSLMKVA
jgi:transcriptional regulator with XRE-family HTH domain